MLAAQGRGEGGVVALANSGSGRGGSGGHFTQLVSAWLALVCIGRVLGVVRWQGNWRQYWCIGGGESEMGCCRLRASGIFAGWFWGGHVGRVVLMGHWRWCVDGAGALSHSICPNNTFEVPNYTLQPEQCDQVDIQG